jgi:putative Holliday junction resolvase
VKPRKRLLGVDFGTVRVGLAITDEMRIIASPLATYQRRDEGRDAEFFRQLVEREEVGGLVVGLPVHMSGDEGGKATEARKYGTWLAQIIGVPVAYWDERFTTVEAEAHLRSAGLSHQRRKARRDRVAAQILLQSYLEAGCPSNPSGPRAK